MADKATTGAGNPSRGGDANSSRGHAADDVGTVKMKHEMASSLLDALRQSAMFGDGLLQPTELGETLIDGYFDLAMVAEIFLRESSKHPAWLAQMQRKTASR